MIFVLQRDITGTAAVGQPARVEQSGRRVPAWTRRITRTDRRALGLWAGAHLGLAVAAWMTAWSGGNRSIYNALIGTYEKWDADWYRDIARHGYFSGHTPYGAPAFLPGLPAVLALVHLAVRNWAVTGLLVSAVAGAVAVVCIGRLGGERAVVYLLAAPAVMYLMVGYSEALFLALALPAWMAAKRRDWPTAGFLGALAGLVRVNGLFLIAGLLVAAATSERGTRLRAAAWTSIAAIGPAVYEIYLWTGGRSWTVYLAANRAWNLHFTLPWRAWANTWHMAFGPNGLPPDRAAMFQIEIACMLAGVALAAVLAWRRMWSETVYVGLTFLTLGTTTYYQATPRALLVSWPLYLLVAEAAKRRPWIGQAYLWVSVPLAVLVAVGFLDGLWAV